MVRPGDSLYNISIEYGIPLVQLIRANPQLSDINQLRIGQVIYLPYLLSVPEQLMILESNAEYIMDDIFGLEWQDAEERLNVIRSNMSDLEPLLQNASVPQTLISRINSAIQLLDQNIGQRRRYPAIAQANIINSYIPDILDYFEEVVPSDLERLDYLGRSIIFNVDNRDWAEANANYLRLKPVWDRLKQRLNRVYANDVSQFDQYLSDLAGSINRRDYRSAINNATNMLNLLEVLEANFIEQYS